MKYRWEEIAEIIEADVLHGTTYPHTITSVCIDSRKIVFPNQSIFIALNGIKNNGHLYLKDAYDKGIRNFIVSKEVSTESDANYLKVSDTLSALQKLATYHRGQFPNLKVVAITGSYGKTTVKEWLYELLHIDLDIVRSPKSYNSQIGVALSLLQIEEWHEMAIIEAGISEKGEMERLEKMIRPTVGLLCNIGNAHARGFISQEEKLQEKLKLFSNCDAVILEEDLASNADHLNGKLVKWTFQILEVNHIESLVLLTIDSQTYTLTFPFSDEVSIQNAINAMSVAYHFDYEINELISQLKELSPISMRLEIKKGINQSVIINDAYIADLDSLEIALNFQKQESRDKSKILLLSDFQIAEDQKDKTYKAVQNLVNEFKIKTFYTIGSDLKKYVTQTKHFNNKEEIKTHFRKHPLQNNAILIKGSREYQLESISDFLSNQLNDTILEIDLTALASNVSRYHSLLKPSTQIIGIIKAGAYGSGSVKIAEALLQLNIKMLAVAFSDEGVELRQAGIDCPIIILNPQISTLPSIAVYDLEPEVYSLKQLQAISHTAIEYFKVIGLHINLNTGMNRLGLEASDIDEALQIIKGNPLLRVESVFSHLSASDSADLDGYSKHQFMKFEQLSEIILDAIDYDIMRHILNSGGISRFSAYQYDAVRLGLGMYGIDTTGNLDDLDKVHLLKSKIIQIKTYPEGTSIGYNRSYVAKKEITVATIPIGYADGLPRSAGNERYHILINTKKAPILGNVCMDLIMVDITDIQDVTVGTTVTIFGKDHPIEDLAQICGTIPYEVLSNMSPRLRRIFIQE